MVLKCISGPKTYRSRNKKILSGNIIGTGISSLRKQMRQPWIWGLANLPVQ